MSSRRFLKSIPWWRWVCRRDEPPGLDEIFGKLWHDKRNARSRSSGGGMSNPNSAPLPMGIAFIGLFLLWFLAGWFVVSPAEKAVVLQFGRYHDTWEPGLHWLPRFIRSETKVNVEKIDSFSYKSEMLTADENIVDVAVSVQYRVGNARDYLYSVVDPRLSLGQATASALRQVVGSTTLDDILTVGRDVAKREVAVQLKKTLEVYHLGLEVTDVNLLPAQPPQQVTEAFDDAIKAREDEQRYINQAQAYRERVIPIAEGHAARLLEEAEADRQSILMNAQSQVAKFDALLSAYLKQPTLVGRQIYLQGMESVLANTTKVVVGGHESSPLLYLPMDRLLASSSDQKKLSLAPLSTQQGHHGENSAEKSSMTGREVQRADLALDNSGVVRGGYSDQ